MFSGPGSQKLVTAVTNRHFGMSPFPHKRLRSVGTENVSDQVKNPEAPPNDRSPANNSPGETPRQENKIFHTLIYIMNTRYKVHTLLKLKQAAHSQSRGASQREPLLLLSSGSQAAPPRLGLSVRLGVSCRSWIRFWVSRPGCCITSRLSLFCWNFIVKV